MPIKHRLNKHKESIIAKKDSVATGYGAGRERFLAYLEKTGRKHPSVSVVTKALAKFFRQDMTINAGNFAYSAFLAFFPLVFIVLSIVGYFCQYNPSSLNAVVDFLKKLMPDFGASFPKEITQSIINLRGVVGVIGLIGLLWSVSRISYAIDRGFSTIWGTPKRSYFRKKLFAFGVLILVGLVGIAGLALTYFSSQALGWINAQVGPFLSGVCLVLGFILGPAATFLIFATLYKVIPSEKPRIREVFWGALAATIVLGIGEYILSFYFKYVSKYQALFGSLGIIVGIVLWLYIVGILVFYGAEVVHTLQEKRGLEGETPDEEAQEAATDGAEL